MAILLSLTTFITIAFYENPTFPVELPFGFTAATITTPIIATYFLKFLYPYFSLNIKATDGKHHIYRLFNYVFVFFIAYFLTMGVYILVDYVMDYIIDEFNPLEMNLPEIIILSIRDILVQIFWFFGMHGEHMVNALFGKEILFKEIFPNLTYGEFQRLFVNMGGAGVGIALLIALLLSTKDKTIKTIAEIASIFTIFNIDTIVIFLVVVFNRFLLLPFVLVPLLNIIIAYLILNIAHINFSDYYIVWTMPVFLDAYLKTNSFLAILLQLFLLIIDTIIYLHFMKKFFHFQSTSTHAAMLEQNLDIADELKAKEDIKAFQSNQELIEANLKIREIIDDLNKERLFIYYQPKVDIKNNKIEKFEALIRYKKNNQIKGPFFLSTIEKAGLAPIIDVWACKQVKKDLLTFNSLNCYPYISINLHPDTLKSNDAISKIIELLKGKKIFFEIVERSFVNKKAKENIKKLQQNGFKLSIDDYGVGYSSLETLIKYNIDEVKLDKSLIDKIETKKGYIICAHTIELCKDLNISIVAEGV
jgi:EAL domain-containing protein (putative c-di-GMP-specific phosphodiesterase class I)